MGTLPVRSAGILRSLLEAHCIEPAIREMPWLAGSFRVLGDAPSPAGNLRAVES